jgi:diguanylate cyclase (GGDEF)-like protein/PAS domain S-box-containing protein
MSFHFPPDKRILSRIREFNHSLDKLMRIYTQSSMPIGEFIKLFTEEACSQLKVERASVWELRDDQAHIECSDMFDTRRQEHSTGAILYASDFPTYFNAVLTERVITAGDANADPRTKEFSEVYLKPNEILSMLDTQIRSAAGPRGVICLESTSSLRNWSPDEAAYAASLAELLGFFMDREDRAAIYAELKQTNAKLEAAVVEAELARERHQFALDAASDGIWDWDLASNEAQHSEQNYKLLGEEIVESDNSIAWFISRIHPDDRDAVAEGFQNHLIRDTPYSETYRIRHRDGTWRWWRSRGQAIRDEQGKAIRAVGTNSDVTELVSMQSELKRRNADLMVAKQETEAAALHDALTELPNRRHLQKVFADIALKASARDCQLALLHIDLDFFKDVNDRFGHAIGDATLKKIAAILENLRNNDEMVARIGGDEFIAILFDTEDATRARQFCGKLFDALDQTNQIDGCKVALAASVGVALNQGQNNEIWSLLSDADLALYEAKNTGRNKLQIFDEDLRARSAFARNTKEELRNALLRNGQIIPFFQPQFCAKTMELVGFEVLARWDHPTRGILTPDKFLDYCAELNCLAEIDRQILARTVECAEQWAKAGFNPDRLSLNVSSDRLVDPDLIASVEELGDRAPFLSFELLESTFLDDTDDEVRAVLDRLRALNVEVEIDDFGSGYASILSLVNVRPARLKIDASLTRNAETDHTMHSLIASIVGIARALKIEVVAEGVENSEQCGTLMDIGCDILQGYWLGRPIHADRVLQKYGNLG